MTFLLFVATLYGFGLTTFVNYVDWSIASTLCWRERENPEVHESLKLCRCVGGNLLLLSTLNML